MYLLCFIVTRLFWSPKYQNIVFVILFMMSQNVLITS